MIKNNLLLPFFLLLSPIFSEANNAPPPSESVVKPAADARLILQRSAWDHLLEYRFKPMKGTNFQSVEISSRHHFGTGYMVGAFVRYSMGERHYIDWTFDPKENEFAWESMHHFFEWGAGVMVQKKWQLTSQLFGELRLTFDRHIGAKMDFLRVRPGLIFQQNPRWTHYFRFEPYLLLNSGAQSIFYRYGYYAGSLYSGFGSLLIGPFFRLERQQWFTSPDYLKRTGRSYFNHDDTYSLGISLIYVL